jgi:two-component system, response regulator YesN
MTRLLIVEDEMLIAESLSSMDEWKQRNIEVVGIATNGSEAIKWVENECPDIILSDIQMPDKNGLELLQYLSENKKEVDTIIISGFDQFSYAQTAIKYNAKGYVLKPIDTDELFEIVDKIIVKQKTNALSEFEYNNTSEQKSYHEVIVYEAIKFVKENLNKPITLKEVAQKVHLTPHYFGQIFKSVTGENFVPFLTKVKMEEACKLLKDPLYRIYQISDTLGFSDPHYFTKVFLKTYGKSPKKYRELLVKEESK